MPTTCPNLSFPPMQYPFATLALGLLLFFAGLPMAAQAQSNQESGFLGVAYMSVPSSVSNSEKLPEGAVLVTDVAKNSPAEKAGIQQEDIVISFNGQQLASPGQFQEYLSNTRTGDSVVLGVTDASDRNLDSGRTLTITLTSGESNDKFR